MSTRHDTLSQKVIVINPDVYGETRWVKPKR